MVIYIRVEVSRREFDGRLLLALVAAERGHHVALGKISLKGILSGDFHGLRVVPGLMHLKSMAGSVRFLEQHRQLRRSGIGLTFQDEEHGLNALDEEQFGATMGVPRYRPEYLAEVERCFAWGDFDGDWLGHHHRTIADRILVTGSPRIDLWRPDVNSFARTAMPPGGAPYVLIASSTSPFAQMPFWVRLFNERGIYFTGDEDPVEFAQYEGMAVAYRFVAELVRGVRRLARVFPDVRFVLRPHHFEIPQAWEAILGDAPNVCVSATGPSLSWVRGAAAVVHSGSTLGMEATVAGIPVISFNPNGMFDDYFADSLGVRAGSVEALVECVGRQLSSGDASTGDATRAAEAIRTRFAALDGPLASDRIVDEWERLGIPEGRLEPVSRSVVARARGRLAVAKQRLVKSRAAEIATAPARFKPDSTPKFPPLDMAEVLDTKQRLSETLDRFHDVEVLPISTHDVLVRQRR